METNVKNSEVAEVMERLLNIYKDGYQGTDSYDEAFIKQAEYMIGHFKGEMRFGCHCDIESMADDFKPDGCVIDTGAFHECVYAGEGMKKEDCEYWKEIKNSS